jgi:CMP-N-acetylneuraminic acid synthetase
METLAVIPARKGSKGIRRKNIRRIMRKPLIDYQIENALMCEFISDVVVSTDDPEVAAYASTFSVDVRNRPQELAADSTTLDPVILDATEFMESMHKKSYDSVITMQPTSPLLTCATLVRSYSKFVKENLDTLVPIIDSTHLYWREVDDLTVPDYEKRVNRQYLPRRYRETGAFLLTRRKYVTVDSRFGPRTGTIIMDEIEGLDIDSVADWIVAESALARLKITFIVNGNSKVGLGHVYRTISLADQMLGNDIEFLSTSGDKSATSLIGESGYQVRVVSLNQVLQIVQKQQPDIVVNDILDTDRHYVKALQDSGTYVVNFEDMGEGASSANLVVNALYERSSPPSNHLFGYEYECLNERFTILPPRLFQSDAESLMITFGGVDHNNLTCRALGLVPEISKTTDLKRYVVVVGPGYSHNAQLNGRLDALNQFGIELHREVGNMQLLMNNVDIALTSNGRTVYELAAMGIPTISIAQNNRETLHLFARYHKGIRYQGIASELSDEELLQTIRDVANDAEKRQSMYEEQINSARVIRKGSSRVISEILSRYRRWKNESEDSRKDH